MNDIVVDLAILRNAVFRTNTSKLVWFCLARDMGDDNTVTTSALAISKEIGVSEKAVRNILKSLSENGLIECMNVTQSPNKSPNKSPKKVRYIGRAIRLNGIACYNGSKNRQVRKKSESKSELKSESITPTVTTKISSDTLIETPTMKAKTVRYETPEKLDFETIRTQLLFDTPWQESMLRTIGLTEAELSDAIERYPDHCIAIGEPRKTLKEAKYHIANWLRRQKYSSHQTSYETKREDRFSERRGTDPSANRAEDYPTAL